MRFNNAIEVLFTEFNDFGEAEEVSSQTIKCVVIEHKDSRTAANNNVNEEQAGLVVLCPRKSYEPYSSLLHHEGLRFRYDSKLYIPLMVAKIYDSAGRVKYFKVTMKEAT